MGEKKGNIFVRAWRGIVQFFSEVYAEMSRVVWPSREELTSLTGVVLVAIFSVGFFVFVLDVFFSWLFSRLGS